MYYVLNLTKLEASEFEIVLHDTQSYRTDELLFTSLNLGSYGFGDITVSIFAEQLSNLRLAAVGEIKNTTRKKLLRSSLYKDLSSFF